jgi:uncharacterized delta-60 repeat protein
MIRHRPARSSHSILLALVAFAPFAGDAGSRGESSDLPSLPLDTTFGGVGYVETTWDNGEVVLPEIVLVEGGKTVLCGSRSSNRGAMSLVAFRFLADGRRDPSLRGAGGVWMHLGHLDGDLRGAHREDDGTLLLVGWTSWKPQPANPSTDDILLLRYRDDGTLDAAPGDTGVDLVDLGGQERVTAVAFPTGERAFYVAGNRDGRAFAAKVLDRGAQLDVQSFAAPHGWIAPEVGGSSSGAEAMTLDPEGRLVVAGWVEADGDRDAVIARLLPSGALDARFGAGGVARLPRPGWQEARAVAVQPDGRLVVATEEGGESGQGLHRSVLLRLLPSGALDPAFGAEGLVHVGPGFLASGPIVMALMRDGRILLAGQAERGGSGTYAEDLVPVIARLSPDGAPDPTFGAGGKAAFAAMPGPEWGGAPWSTVWTALHQLALTPDEHHLLVSGTWAGTRYVRGFLARLQL